MTAEETSAAAGSSLCVCVATYNRPRQLKALLSSLAQLRFDEFPQTRLSLLVVDNSDDGNAEGLVSAAARRLNFETTYVHEQRRGISHARNACLDFVTKRFDFLAFIDDDEIPSVHWLDELLKVRRRTQAHAVMGAVRARFDRRPSRWIRRGKYFDIAKYPDAARIDYGHTCNCLLDVAALRTAGVRFRESYGTTGGEDTMFFAELRRLGLTTVWSSQGYVEDLIPAERASLGWLMRRWYRTGNTDGRIIREFRKGAAASLQTALGGLTRIVAGALLCVLCAPAIPAGRADIVAWRLRTLCRGAGFLASAGNAYFEEYRRPEGDSAAVVPLP